MHRTFVYGSLKRGFWNNSVMTRGGGQARFIEEVQTVGPFRMWCVGFPLIQAVFKANEPHQGHVLGELWEVDAIALANMDRLESNGSMYLRKEIGIVGHEAAWCYLWLGHPRGAVVAPDAAGMLNWRGAERDAA